MNARIAVTLAAVSLATVACIDFGELRTDYCDRRPGGCDGASDGSVDASVDAGAQDAGVDSGTQFSWLNQYPLAGVPIVLAGNGQDSPTAIAITPNDLAVVGQSEGSAAVDGGREVPPQSDFLYTNRRQEPFSGSYGDLLYGVALAGDLAYVGGQARGVVAFGAANAWGGDGGYMQAVVARAALSQGSGDPDLIRMLPASIESDVQDVKTFTLSTGATRVYAVGKYKGTRQDAPVSASYSAFVEEMGESLEPLSGVGVRTVNCASTDNGAVGSLVAVSDAGVAFAGEYLGSGCAYGTTALLSTTLELPFVVLPNQKVYVGSEYQPHELLALSWIDQARLALVLLNPSNNGSSDVIVVNVAVATGSGNGQIFTTMAGSEGWVSGATISDSGQLWLVGGYTGANVSVCGQRLPASEGQDGFVVNCGSVLSPPSAAGFSVVRGAGTHSLHRIAVYGRRIVAAGRGTGSGQASADVGFTLGPDDVFVLEYEVP